MNRRRRFVVDKEGAAAQCAQPTILWFLSSAASPPPNLIAVDERMEPRVYGPVQDGLFFPPFSPAAVVVVCGDVFVPAGKGEDARLRAVLRNSDCIPKARAVLYTKPGSNTMLCLNSQSDALHYSRPSGGCISGALYIWVRTE